MAAANGGFVIDPAEVGRRLEAVRERIASAGGDPERTTVVAVTKGFGPDAVAAVAAAGLVDVGENYAQEMLAKAAAAGEGAGASGSVRWHAIGRLQTNKVKGLAPVVHLWQSIDRRALVDELATRAAGAQILVQVDITGEPRKGGCRPADVADLVARATDAGLRVRGLMAMGPAGDVDRARRAFASLSSLADRLDLEERSMGMTADLEAAVAEGATMVRVGTALLGPRPVHRWPGGRR